MTMVREPLQVVELLQPLCANVFGDGVCRARLTGTTDGWDGANKGAGVALTGDDDKAATTASTAEMVMSMTGKPSGKHYVEISLDAITNDTIIGFTSADDIGDAGGYVTDNAYSFGVFNTGSIGLNDGSYTAAQEANGAGDVLCFAIDVDNELFWYRVNDGAWHGQVATADPEAGTGGYDISGLISGTQLKVIAYLNVASVTFRSHAGEMEYEAPEGFAIWGIASTVAAKCFNTRATCADITSFTLGDPLSICFVKDGANRPTETGFDPSTAIPSLVDVRTDPTVLNIASGDKDFSPLGLRAVANVVIADHRYNDAGLDPYLADRGYDVEAQGTMWGRWLARNPYHTGYQVNVYDGYRGDSLAEMIKRAYFIDKIDRTAASVRITAKDVLRRITDTDIKAPEASTGVLAADIDDSVTSLTIAGAVLADYPAPGRIRIGDEIIAYTGAAESSGNLDFTGLTRGVLNTSASAHSQDDGAQWVLSYEDERFEDIIYDLLVTRAGIPASYVDLSAWQAEAAQWRALYIFTRHMTTPQDMHKLVGELVQQSQTHLWWDERQQKIRMEAQRANSLVSDITEAGEIVAGSFSIREDTKDRASRVDVYYGLRDPTRDPGQKASYRAVESVIDVESVLNYGEAAEKEIFAQWIPTEILARSLATNFVARFKDARKRATFQLTAKDIETLWTGDAATLQHWMEQNPDGSALINPWIITSAETVEQGALYKFTAEGNLSAGLLWLWVAEASYPATWAEATPAQRKTVGYWCDADGKNPDGTPSPFRWL